MIMLTIIKKTSKIKNIWKMLKTFQKIPEGGDLQREDDPQEESEEGDSSPYPNKCEEGPESSRSQR